MRKLPAGCGADRRYPEVTFFSLHSLPVLSTPVYELTAAGRRVIVDAASGQQLSPLSAGMIRRLARSYYAGSRQLSTVTLLDTRRRWKCAAERRRCGASTSMIGWKQRSIASRHRHASHAASSGLAVVRLPVDVHIMDYGDRETGTGVVPRVATVLGAVTVLSGVWLLYFSFWRPRAARR